MRVGPNLMFDSDFRPEAGDCFGSPLLRYDGDIGGLLTLTGEFFVGSKAHSIHHNVIR